MKKSKILMISLMIISLIITSISLIFLNDVIPTHIGINGKPDQFGSKYFILLFPLIGIVFGVIMIIVYESKKVTENYKKNLLRTGVVFEGIFLLINIIFVVFALLYVDEYNMFDASKFVMIIVGILLICISNFMPKIEKNRTLGIKIYWSMYNEVTWQKTHRFAGFVGVVIGILMIALSPFFEENISFIILLVLILTYVTTITIASYCYYKKEKENEIL